MLAKRGDAYRELFMRHPHPMWVFDLTTRKFLDVNDATCAAYGYTRSQMLTMSTDEIRSSREVETYRRDVALLANQFRLHDEGVRRHRRADGSIFSVDFSSSVVDFSGRRACMVLATDATARLAVSRALTESRTALADAQELAHLGSYETNFTTGEMHWSAELYRVLGVDPSRERPTMLYEFDHPDDAETIRAAISRAKADRTPFAVEHRIRTRDGHERHVFESGRFSYDAESGKPRRAVGAVLDITDRKIAEQRLRHLAEHDSLTMLPNRTLASRHLVDAVERARTTMANIAVYFIDIDRFKAVNDTMSHAAGDALLAEIALRLETTVGTRGLVGRPGGDEFIVVIDELDTDDEAIAIGEELRSVVARPVRYDGTQRIEVSASVGFALFPRDGETPEELLRGADTAMYAAKARGGNALEAFTPALHATERERIALERSLRSALDRGTIDVAYQPIVASMGGRVVALEALVRWNEDGRAIEPAHFVAIAESAGLIGRLGGFVLRRACAQARSWLDSIDPQLVVSVNISALQFREPTFVDFISDTLAQFDLPAANLQLEITESAYVGADTGIANVRRLKDLGVKVSIDDFGTGYSSLGYLKRLPVDALKIDRSFVNDIATDPADRAIVRAIIAVADNLGLSVIAEGVETREQAECLAIFGCSALQGFYFSQPLHADAVEGFAIGREGTSAIDRSNDESHPSLGGSWST
jgi:diguanylate cyclase (GGDEF)-like protein/PAS domain S-box-containing protein